MFVSRMQCLRSQLYLGLSALLQKHFYVQFSLVTDSSNCFIPSSLLGATFKTQL